MTQSDSKAPASPDKPVSRRGIVRGAAWTVPVVAASIAAPAMAASQLCEGTLDWQSNYTRTSASSASGVATTDGGHSVPYTVQARYANYIAGAPGSLTTVTSPDAGLAVVASTVTPSANLDIDGNYNMYTTVTFDEPVSNVGFTISDVDRMPTTAEYVRVTGHTGTPGAALAGPIYDGFYYSPSDGDGGGNPDYSIVYAIPGPVTSFEIIMSKPATFDNAWHGVILSDITFSVPCGSISD